MDAPYRPGNTVPEFPSITLLLSGRSTKKYHILVGSDPFQIKFAEQALGLPCVPVERVDDETLLTGPRLLCITTAGVADLSESIRNSTAFWSLGPLGRGSSGALAVVRFAAAVLKMERPSKDDLRLVADALASDGIDDIRAAIWKAVWLLLGPVPAPFKRWTEPWEDSRKWLDGDTDPAYRLNTLFRDLSAYAFLASDEEESLKKANLALSPSRLRYLKGLKLDPLKVHDTVYTVSAWRMRKQDPYVCALRVSAIWQH